MNIETNKQIALTFIDALSRGDSEHVINAYHPDAICWTTGNTLISGKRGVEELKTFAAGVLDAFPNGLEFAVTGVTAEGNRVAVECESDGKHASGAHYHNYYHFLFEIENGKILALKEYMDTEMVTDILCGGQRPAS